MPDINTIYADMPETIKSFVVCNPDLSYTIVLNSKMSYEQNLISYAHEIAHIKNNDYDKKCDVDVLEYTAHHTNLNY
ncbi:MAG: ImmA/IrrE family metallo-endopeptidase [Lachnospiraceae bacterium]|nr:ImmA/IrrE family metallo-endopeptidase [Lachnospiraceae bacterium]